MDVDRDGCLRTLPLEFTLTLRPGAPSDCDCDCDCDCGAFALATTTGSSSSSSSSNGLVDMAGDFQMFTESRNELYAYMRMRNHTVGGGGGVSISPHASIVCIPCTRLLVPGTCRGSTVYSAHASMLNSIHYQVLVCILYGVYISSWTSSCTCCLLYIPSTGS